MSYEPAPHGTDETLDDSRRERDGRDVAELRTLFEDVTGTTEVVDEQDDVDTSRDVTDGTAMSTDAIDDGLTDAIDEPDVDDAL